MTGSRRRGASAADGVRAMHAEARAVEELGRLRNLGPYSARLLVEAGIRSADELRAIGAAGAFRRVLFARGGRASTNLLWAIAGALTDTRWDRLPADVRERLLAEVEAGDG